jgi:hypothetical protein
MLRLRLIALPIDLRNFHQRGPRSAVCAFVPQDFDIAKVCYIAQGLGDLRLRRERIRNGIRVGIVALALVRRKWTLESSATFKTQVNRPSKLIPLGKSDLWGSHVPLLQRSRLTVRGWNPSRKLSLLDRAREQI